MTLSIEHLYKRFVQIENYITSDEFLDNTNALASVRLIDRMNKYNHIINKYIKHCIKNNIKFNFRQLVLLYKLRRLNLWKYNKNLNEYKELYKKYQLLEVQ